MGFLVRIFTLGVYCEVVVFIHYFHLIKPEE